MIRFDISQQSAFVPEFQNPSAWSKRMQIHLWTCAYGLVVLVSLARSDYRAKASVSTDPACDDPPSLPFASIQEPVTSPSAIGTTVTYACEFGYVAVGTKRTAECIRTKYQEAEWTKTDVSCKPRSCGDPGFVPKSNLVGALFTFPNSVTFECEEGYRLYGNAKRYCQASGSWSGTLPRCQKVFCQPPQDPKNGIVSYESLEYGSELKFECQKGYHRENEETVYCTSDGTWSETDVQCVEVSCAGLESPKYGTMEIVGPTDKPRAGALAVFSCKGERIPDGPTTSKCLDTGQWTFPTPKCLEPCSVPEVSNGKIGRYVRGRGYQSVFKEIPVGSRLEDDEKLFLHCSAGYSPLGTTTNWQERVACSGGKWAEIPFCEPKSCQSDPPATQNGRLKEVQPKHGGTVLYECLPNFKKTKSGNVVCLFGEWKGETPVCRDTRCSADELAFPGMEKGSQLVYRDGEKLEIICNQKYRPARQMETYMKCEDGFWKGPMPPCVAADCSGAPPSIDHGRPLVISSSHSSVVQYACDHHYMLVKNGDVQCLFGEWSGNKPTCKDSRCYLKDIRHCTGLSSETESFTLSGNRLNVRCTDGYGPQTQVPMCHNGVWSRKDECPCKEKDCTVPWISGGDVVKHTLGPKEWSFWEFRYVRKSIFTKQYTGSVPSREDSLYLDCQEGHSVQGTGVKKAAIHCSQGRWSPDLVCLRAGTRYVTTTRSSPTTMKTTTKPTTTTAKPTTTKPTMTTAKPMTTKPTMTTAKPMTTKPRMTTAKPKTTLAAEVIHGDERTTEGHLVAGEVECTCEYTSVDEKVVAYSEGKELNVADILKRGSVVRFRCKEVGLHHLIGQRELTCETCQPWGRSDFPVCINPKQGDTVIVYSDNVNVSLDGALEVRRGQSVRLTCIAVEEAQYPSWRVPDDTGIVAVPERMERQDDYLYMSHLDIENPNFHHEGFYDCGVEKYPATTVELRVIDPYMRCPSPEFDGEMLRADAEGTHVGAKVNFSCWKQGQILNGTDVLTCLRNGEWSGIPPECEDIRCRKFEGTELLHISYTGDRTVGSFADFHCFAPGQRSGVVRTLCLDSGEWNQPAPTCKTPPCSALSLFSSMPPNVEPEMEDVYNETLPSNTKVRLACKVDMVLWGSPVATCGQDGQWIVEDAKCVDRTAGCPKLVKEDTNLIIKPDKDSYTFGDIVTFVCTPGYDLDIENSRTMCLNGRWTESTLPKCVLADN